MYLSCKNISRSCVNAYYALCIFTCWLNVVYLQESSKAARNFIIENDGNVLNVGQTVKKKANVSEFRLLVKKTPEGKLYGVYDNLITSKEQYLLKSYLTYDNTEWLFNNYDAENENQQRTYDNTAWINNKNPLAFASTALCKKLISVVKDVSNDESEFYPYRVFGKIIRRGDNTRVARDSQHDNEYTVMVFLNEFWRKNYYGELYFYDDQKEIVGGATHKSARLVVWRSDIYRLNRPPAVQFQQGQLLFQVQFTTDENKMIERHKDYAKYKKARDEAHENWFIPEYQIPGGLENLDIESHKTFEYTTKNDGGRKIFVFDNLFPKDLLDHLRSFVLKYGTYFYDDSIDNMSDNVQWIAGFFLDPYIKSPYWKIIQKAASYATGNAKMFPYDVSINLVRNADYTRIHEDVGYHGEEEFTCLVYLNPNWNKNYYGETTFFDKNSDDTEIVAQVRPRYGRLVIFDGNIPHSARPPSFNFSGARLTFVTKLHRNEYAGRRKNFQEELRFIGSIVDLNLEINMLEDDNGEEYAKNRLDRLRQMQFEMTYSPDPELEGEPDPDEERPEQNEDGPHQKEDGPHQKEDGPHQKEDGPHQKEDGPHQKEDGPHQKEDETQESMLLAQKFVVREETPIIDDDFPGSEIITRLVKPLLGVNEKTQDAVELLKNTHQIMTKKNKKYVTRYSEKILKVL